MSFEKLGLHPTILAGVKANGYTEPTPIQQQAIPVIVQGRDMLARAQTGTGKTAAFTLPLLHLLSAKIHAKDHRPRALVLAPTRELAAQVAASVKTYSKGLHLHSAVIFGGVNINPQIHALRKGADIVIGTPGRLLDLVGQKALDLSRIEILVLDEADRMLDMGFIHDIRRIIALLPKKRQSLFFSATYSKEVKALADTILHNPAVVEIANQSMAADTVTQSVYHVAQARKQKLLAHLILTNKWSQVLVFTKTKHGANRLAQQLVADGIQSTVIHGNKSQGARTKALADFKQGQVRVLVATDIAARGLDIDRLPHVVNYELPYVAEDYVHRIGRTGRAGCTGEAISLVDDEESGLLGAIERLIKKVLPLEVVDGLTEQGKTLNKNAAPPARPQGRQGSGGRRGGGRGGSGRGDSRGGNTSSSARPGGFSLRGGSRGKSQGGGNKRRGR